MQTAFQAALRAHRHGALMGFCLLFLLFIAVAALLPRNWTAVTLVRIAPWETDPDDRFLRVGEPLKSIAAQSGIAAHAVVEGPDLLRIRVSADSPERALDQLGMLLSAMRAAELDARRGTLLVDVDAAQAELQEADLALAEADARLEAFRLAARGDAPGLQTRVAELESNAAESDRALQALRQADTALAGKQRELEARERSLQSAIDADADYQRQIGALRARLQSLRSGPGNNVAAVEELEREVSALAVEQTALLSARDAADAELAGQIRPALADISAQRKDLSAALTEASSRADVIQRRLLALREEVAGSQGGNRSLQELENVRRETSLLQQAAMNRLQAQRDRSVVGASSGTPGFRVIDPLKMPTRADGPLAWVYVLLAAMGAGLPVLVYLLMAQRSLRRAAHAGAASASPEAPVVRIRWQAVVASVLLPVCVTAAWFFLLVFG